MLLISRAIMLGGVSGNIIVKDEGKLPTGSFKLCDLALAVKDDQIMQIHNDIVGENGILLYPEGAVKAAAHQLTIKRGLVKGDETAIVFNRATRLKYPMPPVAGTLENDWPNGYVHLPSYQKNRIASGDLWTQHPFHRSCRMMFQMRCQI